MSDGQNPGDRGRAPRWTNPGETASESSAAEGSPREAGGVRLADLVGTPSPGGSSPPPSAADPAQPAPSGSPRVIEAGPIGGPPVRIGWSETEPAAPTPRAPEPAQPTTTRAPEPAATAPSQAPGIASAAAATAGPAAATTAARRSSAVSEPVAPVAAPAVEPRRAAPEPPEAVEYRAPPRTGRPPLPDPYSPPPPERFGSRALLLGAAGLVLLALVAFLLLRSMSGGREEAPATAGVEGGTRVQISEPPATRDVPAPDREAVRAAYSEVSRIYAAEQVAGLAATGERCFAALGRDSGYRDLDYCLAFDAFGAAFARREAGAPAPAESYFGRSEARALQAGETVMRGAADPSVRLVQIRQLALEVAREGSRTYATAPPQAEPSSPAPAASGGNAPVGARPVPVPRTSPEPAAGPAPGPSPERTRRADAAPPARPPAAPVQPEPRPVARAETGPTAAEIAAARPREGRGPSFNCRFARSDAEQLVCSNPRLANLDRRLNAAYEDAIAGGADRRALRAEQDRWLLTREHAAPDPDAVADAYRRRIQELRSMR